MQWYRYRLDRHDLSLFEAELDRERAWYNRLRQSADFKRLLCTCRKVNRATKKVPALRRYGGTWVTAQAGRCLC
jgi:hypothetical protein